MTQPRWLILLVCGMTAILTASPVFACTNFVGDFWVWSNNSGYDTTGTLAVQVTGLQPPNDPSQAMTQTVNATVAKATSARAPAAAPTSAASRSTPSPRRTPTPTHCPGTYDVNTINVGYANHTTWLNPNGDCMSFRYPSPVTKVGDATIGSAGKITSAHDASGGSLTVAANIAGEYKIPTSYVPGTSPQEAGICISDSTSTNGNQAPLTMIGGACTSSPSVNGDAWNNTTSCQDHETTNSSVGASNLRRVISKVNHS